MTRLVVASYAAFIAIAALVGAAAPSRLASAAFPWPRKRHHHAGGATACPTCAPAVGEGAWLWMRSPEQERQAIASLYNRYCIRCHGVDGRGVWDIPGVPNFADPRRQASRDDGSLARSIIEGRGAVMPPFRGTLTYEEACATARYLRTFVPGSEIPRPDRVPSAGGPAAESATNILPRSATSPASPAAGPFAQ